MHQWIASPASVGMCNVWVGCIVVVSSFRIDCAPDEHLRDVGAIFAVFDQQDSGNLSYGVETDGGRYFVKTAGRPDLDLPHLHEQRVALLRNAARIGEAYRHPALPVLHRVIESPHGPMLVYDWVDGELLGVPRAAREEPASAFQRFRDLPIAMRWDGCSARLDSWRRRSSSRARRSISVPPCLRWVVPCWSCSVTARWTGTRFVVP